MAGVQRGIARNRKPLSNFSVYTNHKTLAKMETRSSMGIVSVTEPVLSKARRLMLSWADLAPFAKCRGVLLFEDVATVEMAILVEVVVNRGVNGGEYRTKPVPPETNRLIADIDATLEQEILHLPQRKRTSESPRR